MPSIKDLFLPESADDPDFDLEDFLAEADRAATGSPGRQYAMGGLPDDPEAATPPAAPEAPAPSGEGAGEGDGDLGTGGATPPIAPPVAEPPVPPAPVDPILSLPPERRASLLALDQIMSATPGAVDKVFEALAPVPKPEPKVPEGIDPDGFEAQLWNGQREILDRLDRQDADRQRAEAATQANQRQLQAATVAGQNFSSRYPVLTPEEVVALATSAGQSGLPAALAARPGADLTASYEEALEHALVMDPVLRQRAFAGTAAPPSPAPPVTGPTPEREATKRTLHALSGNAVPVAGPPPASAPLETRADGRFTPESRGMLVDQLAGQLRNAGYK